MKLESLIVGTLIIVGAIALVLLLSGIGQRQGNAFQDPKVSHVYEKGGA